MGLERLACIMQGVDNIFEVDTVQNIMKKSAKYQALSIMKMLKKTFRFVLLQTTFVLQRL